jgi:hypothetical protein
VSQREKNEESVMSYAETSHRRVDVNTLALALERAELDGDPALQPKLTYPKWGSGPYVEIPFDHPLVSAYLNAIAPRPMDVRAIPEGELLATLDRVKAEYATADREHERHHARRMDGYRDLRRYLDNFAIWSWCLDTMRNIRGRMAGINQQRLRDRRQGIVGSNKQARDVVIPKKREKRIYVS